VIFYGACLDGGRLSLVLERVKGEKLSGFVSRLGVWRPHSPQHVRQVSIVKGVCQALIYLHSRQPCVVHLDLKPDNIMVEQRGSKPFPKLLDFGLARRVTRNATHLGGTVKYMAPEIFLQRRNYKPHPAADVYSLGQLLFFVSSGRRPTKTSEAEVSKTMKSGKLPPFDWHPSSVLLRKSRPLVEQCTAHDPASRPSTQRVFDLLCAGPDSSADGPFGDCSADSPEVPIDLSQVDAALVAILESPVEQDGAMNAIPVAHAFFAHCLRGARGLHDQELKRSCVGARELQASSRRS
jgi:serine/threonine protein kinase